MHVSLGVSRHAFEHLSRAGNVVWGRVGPKHVRRLGRCRITTVARQCSATGFTAHSIVNTICENRFSFTSSRIGQSIAGYEFNFRHLAGTEELGARIVRTVDVILSLCGVAHTFTMLRYLRMHVRGRPAPSWTHPQLLTSLALSLYIHTACRYSSNDHLAEDTEQPEVFQVSMNDNPPS